MARSRAGWAAGRHARPGRGCRFSGPKAGKNRHHLDLYPTGRDNALPMERRIEIVEAKVAELTGLGASAQRRTRHDDRADPTYFVLMHDPEGNEFCVG